ncbi:uncharacterized protein K441DRAFT_701265 [Cenococcum geophilum 1.58]|uniref:Uncharacterized protein n=1 Tax=Cenococcum geophilum 1.58 TaxID=794803 RepID=A0ACC8EM22_9PEZI|nr:hypothetical protein K441DRAFT_701265 [Cenococcum geophilum 1.58]
MGLSKLFKPRKSNGVLTPEPKHGDLPLSRTKGQKVTVEEFRELRELIRYRYALDVEIWGLRDVKPYSRDAVEERMRKADAALAKIQRTVNNLDKREFFSSHADYERLKEIKHRVLEPGKRDWRLHPPWEEREAGSGGSA